MVFYTLVLQLYLKNGPKEKKKMTPFWGKKLSVDGKGTVLPVITRGIVWIKTLKKGILKRSNKFNWHKSPD